MAQNRTVKGTVISSEDNEPLIGANVVVVGNTGIGASTDLEGNFTLSVPANAKQVKVSYSGMITKQVNISNVMKIVLDPDAKLLEQVVVVGYGTGQKISTISGSVAKVSSEKLAEKPVANIMDALQGQVPGMQVVTGSGDPNAVASVTIHGVGSLGADSAPLYVVDGIATTLAVVAAMNPNDFESVTVLKDASATSIYGARAANGVVLIQTKRGKMQGNNAGGRVTLSASYGVSSVISKKPLDDMMTGEQFLKYQMIAGVHGSSLSDPNDPDQVLAVQNSYINEATALFNEYGLLKDGMANGTVLPVDFNEDADWLEYFIRPTAPTTQLDATFSGGTMGTTYYVSLGYFDQEGISREPSLFKRYTSRLNLDSRVNDWMKVGFNISGSMANQKASSFGGTIYYNTGTFGALSMPKFLNPFLVDKNGAHTSDLAEAYYIPGATRVFQNPERDYKWYPAETTSYQAIATGYVQLNPIQGLTLKAQVGADIKDSRYTGKSLPNNPLASTNLGSRTESFTGRRVYTSTNTAEYKFNVEDKHNVTLLLGHEFIDSEWETFRARAKGYENANMMLLSQGKTGDNLILPTQNKSEYAYLSFFGRGSYGFDKWLYVDLSLRNDQSSRFGENNRSAMFYSIGTMMDIYNKFIQESSWLNDLRFKISYGTTGNSEIGDYGHQAFVSAYNYTDDDLGLIISSAGNPDLSWEKQSQFNIGLAGSMFNNRLKAEVDFYVRNTNDMLINVPMPYVSGFFSQYQNVGSMRNTGVDINLQGTIYQSKDWNVYASGNISFNKQKITELFYGLDEYVLPGTGTIWQIGKPNSFYMAEYAGIDHETGDMLWYVPGEVDADGNKVTTNQYSTALEYNVGKSVTPDVTGGFSLGASWKGLSLDADFSFILGKWMINNDRYFTENGSPAAAKTNKNKNLLDAWTPDNKDSDVPRLGQSPQFDTHLLENASFLRLKNLKLTYNLPSSLFEGQKVISGARVYFMTRNLFTITKYKGFDPEAGGNVAMNQFPNTKQYMGGIQLTF